MTSALTRQQLNLSGTWQIAFDPAGSGDSGGWSRGNWPEERARSIQVPAIWNLTFPDAEGIAYYRKTFELPPDWAGKAVQLNFGGVSYRAEVWLNGRFAGSHLGAYTPFCLDVTSLINSGATNELIVRVASLSKTQDVDGMVLKHLPASKQSWYYTFGGIWGDIGLEALPMVACAAPEIYPHLAHELVELEVELDNHHPHFCRADLHLQILSPDGGAVFDHSEAVSLLPGANRFFYRIDVPNPQPWDCDHPDLYQLVTEVSESGSPADQVCTAFGMRDFSVQNGQFFLNGSPLFIQGVILQPHYPINLVAPPDPEILAREIELSKQAGFNLIRVHLRPAVPGFLELADCLGMLVYAESTLGWVRESPQLLEHGRRELREMIARDRNHPSVVIWGIYNENPSMSALNSADLVRYARSLDPTRVIVDNSGGSMAIDQDFGWIARTTVVPDRETARQEIQDLHLYLGGLVPEPVYAWERVLGKKNSSQVLLDQGLGRKAVLDEFDRRIEAYRGKIFISELGCGGMSDLEETVALYQGQDNLLDAQEMIAFRDSLRAGFAERRLDQVFGSLKELVRSAQELQAAGNTRHIEAFLANPRCSGYILTQLNDLSWEFHAGILDLWRRPKLVYEAVKRLNQPHVLILNIPDTVIPQGSDLSLSLTLINRVPLAAPAEISVQLLDPEGKEIWSFQTGAPRSAGINPIRGMTIDTPLSPGKYRIKAVLLEHPENNVATQRDIWVFAPVDIERALAGVYFAGARPDWAPDSAGLDQENGGLLLAPQPGELARSEWEDVFAAVRGGQTALLGPLQPKDTHALALLAGQGIPVRLHFGIGNWMGCYHWIPSSQVFAGLPAGGLAGEPYVNVRPRYVLTELGGDVLAGSFNNTQTRREPAAMIWYSDIEKVALGKGKLVFCQYQIFDKADADPLAGRILANLVSLLR